MDENIVKEPLASCADNHYTYLEYLDFTDDERVEIIKGKIFKMSPAPSSLHQIISRNISGLLYNRLKGQKCQFFSAPFDVILPVEGKDFEQSDRVVQPDVCVICDPEKIRKQGCFGAPDWIIENQNLHAHILTIPHILTLYTHGYQ